MTIISLQKEDDYKIIETTSEEFDNLIDSSVSSEICMFNSAYVYTLKDNNYLIVGKVIGDHAVLYFKDSILKKHIENKYFPIPENKHFFENESDNFMEISDKIYLYENYVENRFNFRYDHSKSTYNNVVILENLVKKIESCLTRYDVMALGLYTSNLFRVRHNLFWISEVVFTLNPNWYPLIIDTQEKKYDLMGRLLEKYDEIGQVAISFNYKRAVAYYFDYNLTSKEYFDLINSPDHADI